MPGLVMNVAHVHTYNVMVWHMHTRGIYHVQLHMHSLRSGDDTDHALPLSTVIMGARDN